MRKLLFSAVLQGLMVSTALASGTKIGVNTAVKGNVTIKTGEQAALQAIVSEPVFLEDLVNSPRLGTLQVLLEDRTTFTVGPDCILKIDRFVYDPDKKDRNTFKAKVTKGMFRFMSGNISKANSEQVSIDTPVASLGVRGTIVEGLVGEEVGALLVQSGALKGADISSHPGASLIVLRGPGRNSETKHRKGEVLITSGGKTVTVRAVNMAVFVASPDATPIGPFVLPDSLEQKFDAKLRTAPTGGPSFRPFEFDMQTFDNPVIAQTMAQRGSDQPNAEFENPTSDMDWPTLYEDGLGNPTSCNPNNPNFPNC